MRGLLYDTSIFIKMLRMGDPGAFTLRQRANGAPIWMSAVVLEELYAGMNARNRRALAQLERIFYRTGRILVPNLKDWTEAGKVLALLGAKYGYEKIGKGRLTNDALIVTSASRSGITVITSNVRDFGMLAEFRPLEWRVETLDSY